MTFTQIVDRVCKRLNLTSEDARVRIGEYVNERYKVLTSSLGLEPSRRKLLLIGFDATTEGLPEYTFTGIEKIIRIDYFTSPVWDPLILGPTPAFDPKARFIHLNEGTYDEILAIPLQDRFPRAFAVTQMGSQTVTVRFDAFPPGKGFYMRVEGYEVAGELIDNAQPNFNEDFHDILIHGARADELMKMEKGDKANQAEQMYENRLSALRLFIAKSSYLDIYAGKDQRYNWWNGPGWLAGEGGFGDY